MVGKVLYFLTLLAIVSSNGKNIFEYRLDSYGSFYDYRLDNRVGPILYNITIKPYLLPEDGDKRFTFEGDVDITMRAFYKDLNKIILNKVNLNIWNTWLYDDEGDLLEEINSNNLSYVDETQKLTVSLSINLTQDAIYRLRFNYTGQIRNEAAGFFRTHYTDKEGKTKWLGLTQLQRTDARTLLPCFDEPGFKAKFQLHMIRPNSYNTKSNTHLLYSIAMDKKWFVDHFAVTPIMSTYLFAFVVSEYEIRGDDDFAVISRPEYYNYTEFSYNVGLRTVEACNELFQIPYKELGNEVLQFASIPQFPHNGMENWGLIIMSDAVLIRIPGYTDGWLDKELAIKIFSHEISHTWFGNSVTMGWWSWFWLNEGFAKYYEYFMAHRIYPEYQLDQQFIVNEMHSIFELDGTEITQPLTSPEDMIERTTHIDYKASIISYRKGACFIRMIHNLMGETNFNEAIRKYLINHKQRGVVPADLYEQFKKKWPTSHDFDLDTFFRCWSTNTGYPVVSVYINDKRRIVRFSQNRFLYNSLRNSSSVMWDIPITYATNLKPDFENLKPVLYLKQNKGIEVLRLKRSISWIVLNKKQSNYYRVLYQIPTLRRLRAALSKPGHSGIPVENRAQIVDDLFNFARANYLKHVDVIRFMEYLSEETEYLPWYAAHAGLQRIATRLSGVELKHFVRFINDITKKVYAKLSFKRDTDTVLDIYNRKKLIALLCRYEHEDCNEQASDMVEAIDDGHMEKPVPDFRETLYCSACREYMYSTVLKWYLLEKNDKERQKLWLAISCTKKYAIHYESLIMSPKTSVAEKITGIAQLYKENPQNVLSIFTLLTDDILRLEKALDGWLNTASVISGITAYFTTREQLELLQDFVKAKAHLFGSANETLKQTIPIVEDNLAWAEKRLGSMNAYLRQRSPSEMPTLTISLLLILLLLLYVYRP